MFRRFVFPLGLALAATAPVAAAQQALPPAHPLGPIEAVTVEPMKAVSAIRELPGRRVLVNDIIMHRVLLFDSTLTQFTSVADSTASTANAYGAQPGGLLAYRGDSSLFIDPASLSMLVLDGQGKIARVMSVPRPNEAIFLIGGPFGNSGFDPAGRLVYRGQFSFGTRKPADRGSDPANMMPDIPDSAAIVRVTLATRTEDTVGYYKIPPTKMNVVRTENGFSATSTVNPMPIVDDWALLPDGTVAIVRGKDLHVDFVHPDGSRTSSDKIPFDWERLNDDQKAAVIDSAKQIMEKRRADQLAQLQATRSAGGANGNQRVASGAGGGGGMGQMVMVMRTDGGGSGGANPPTRGSSTQQISLPPLQFVAPYELPDYRPAFTTGSVRADTQGNIWIRTSQVKDDRPLYDVVSEQGLLVDRVLLPPHRSLTGFGPGVVYMGVTDSTGVVHLERARMK